MALPRPSSVEQHAPRPVPASLTAGRMSRRTEGPRSSPRTVGPSHHGAPGGGTRQTPLPPPHLAGTPLLPPGHQTASGGPRRSKPRVTPQDNSPLGLYLRSQQPPSSPARRHALPSPNGLLDTSPSARPLCASSTAGLRARRLRAQPGPERPPSGGPLEPVGSLLRAPAPSWRSPLLRGALVGGGPGSLRC
ncbi:hypothetical protein NDU88_003669 [Pleurodeles waltl]|uniref:Uncharacterized protein n=1 Tax=Pleurodeles waltl TaxID=8319 RepID=A0AAV7M6Y5_PLEWA|nr:hypothetical protein NDU88_003669 [Pleurodeles waltl]